MSAGPGPAEGAHPGPAPRSRTLNALYRELAAAVDVHAHAYAAQLRAQIARLSQGSTHNPGTETTSAARPRAGAARRKR